MMTSINTGGDKRTYYFVIIFVSRFKHHFPVQPWTASPVIFILCTFGNPIRCQCWIVNLESNSYQVSSSSNQRTITEELSEIKTEALPISADVTLNEYTICFIIVYDASITPSPYRPIKSILKIMHDLGRTLNAGVRDVGRRIKSLRCRLGRGRDRVKVDTFSLGLPMRGVHVLPLGSSQARMFNLPPATRNAFSPKLRVDKPSTASSGVHMTSVVPVKTIFMEVLSSEMGLVSDISSSPWTTT